MTREVWGGELQPCTAWHGESWPVEPSSELLIGNRIGK